MANSTRSPRRRTSGGNLPTASGSASPPRFTTWQVTGILAGILTLTAIACVAGLGLGYAWGRASGLAAAQFPPMIHQDWMHPESGFPSLPPVQPVPGVEGSAYLGVTYAALDPDQTEALGLSPGEGAAVVQVVPDGPADQAGLRAGDVIVSVDGERVRPADRLRRMIRALQPGDTIRLEILRDGEMETIRVVLGATSQP